MANGDSDPSPKHFWIDFIREGSRAVIGIGAIYFILRMFSEFVGVADAKDKIQVILLVAGQLATLAAAMVGFYFGGAMRPIRQVAAATETKPPEPFLPPAPPPAEEKPPAPAAVVASKKPEAEG